MCISILNFLLEHNNIDQNAPVRSISLPVARDEAYIVPCSHKFKNTCSCSCPLHTTHSLDAAEYSHIPAALIENNPVLVCHVHTVQAQYIIYYVCRDVTSLQLG